MSLTLQLIAGGASVAGRERKDGAGEPAPAPNPRVRHRPSPPPPADERAKPASVSVRLLWRTTVRAGRRARRDS